MATETLKADSSSAPGIESLNPEERQTWRLTGELPERKPQPSEEKPAAPAADEQEPQGTSAPPSEPETEAKEALESEPSAPKEEPQRKLSPAEKRIKQLLADRKALEDRVRKLEESHAAKPEPAKAEAKATERGRPTPQDKNADGTPKYGTYEEFAEDLADWKVEQRFSERDKAESERKKQADAEQAQRAITEGWQGKVEQGRGKYTDFDEVALNPDLPIAPGGVVDVMVLESPNGTDLLYHLGRNPEELERINKLPPIQAARELFRIETSLSGTPGPRKVTQAPPPAREVGGRGSAPADEVVSAVNSGDFASYRNAANRREIALRKG